MFLYTTISLENLTCVLDVCTRFSNTHTYQTGNLHWREVLYIWQAITGRKMATVIVGLLKLCRRLSCSKVVSLSLELADCASRLIGHEVQKLLLHIRVIISNSFMSRIVAALLCGYG